MSGVVITKKSDRANYDPLLSMWTLLFVCMFKFGRPIASYPRSAWKALSGLLVSILPSPQRPSLNPTCSVQISQPSQAIAVSSLSSPWGPLLDHLVTFLCFTVSCLKAEALSLKSLWSPSTCLTQFLVQKNYVSRWWWLIVMTREKCTLNPRWIHLKLVCGFSFVLNMKWKLAGNILKVRDNKVDFSLLWTALARPIVWISEWMQSSVS